jgi:hypothetical protein
LTASHRREGFMPVEIFLSASLAQSTASNYRIWAYPYYSRTDEKKHRAFPPSACFTYQIW